MAYMSHSKSATFGSKTVYYDPADDHIDEGISYLHDHLDTRGGLFQKVQDENEVKFTNSDGHQFRLKKVDGYIYLDHKSLY